MVHISSESDIIDAIPMQLDVSDCGVAIQMGGTSKTRLETSCAQKIVGVEVKFIYVLIVSLAEINFASA